MNLGRWLRRKRLGHRACAVPTCPGERQGGWHFCASHCKPVLEGVASVADYRAWLEVELSLYADFERPDEISNRFWPPRPYHRSPLLQRYEELAGSKGAA